MKKIIEQIKTMKIEILVCVETGKVVKRSGDGRILYVLGKSCLSLCSLGQNYDFYLKRKIDLLLR